MLYVLTNLTYMNRQHVQEWPQGVTTYYCAREEWETLWAEKHITYLISFLFYNKYYDIIVCKFQIKAVEWLWFTEAYGLFW